MSLIYAALTLRSAGRPITRDSLNAVLKATGVEADQGEIDALLSLLGEDRPHPRREEQGRTESPRSRSGGTVDPDRRALYVYAVAVGEPVPFATAGIEGADVFTIAEGDLVAVVHERVAQPYSSQEGEVVESWVLSHQAVVEEASRHYDAALPMAFDTMVPGKDRAESERRLRTWLHDESDVLHRKADRVRNREEHGIQVMWDLEAATREIMDTCPAVADLKKSLNGKSEAAAYLYQQQMQRLVRTEIEKRAETVFREAFELARKHAVEVSVDKLKRAEGHMRMVANLSCLVEKGGDGLLAAAFNDYCDGDGLTVRVSGPWPPYSFA